MFEDLRIKQMTKRPKAKYNEETGKTERKGAKAKAGLNRAILRVEDGISVHTFDEVQSVPRRGKVTYKEVLVGWEECADCGHTRPRNRASQASFVCQKCGHDGTMRTESGARVLKKRQSNGVLDSWNGVVCGGEFWVGSDEGRGATTVRHLRQTPTVQASVKRQKKQGSSSCLDEYAAQRGDAFSRVACSPICLRSYPSTHSMTATKEEPS